MKIVDVDLSYYMKLSFSGGGGGERDADDDDDDVVCVCVCDEEEEREGREKTADDFQLQQKLSFFWGGRRLSRSFSFSLSLSRVFLRSLRSQVFDYDTLRCIFYYNRRV